MYYGSIYLTKLQSHEILNLLLSSDELGFQPLVKYIQDTLMKNITTLLLKISLKLLN